MAVYPQEAKEHASEQEFIPYLSLSLAGSVTFRVLYIYVHQHSTR